MSSDVETVVIGAGVVGLATASALARAGRGVMVVEQHGRIGAETSSRNSEVIHAGLYYPPGSLKARLCREGRDLLYRMAAEDHVPAPRVGKLLVACEAADIAKLDAIAATARANGVDDLVRLDAAAVHALEPQVRAVAGLLSPSTGIVDSHALMLALEGHLQADDGEIALSTCVDHIRRDPASGHFVLDLESGGTRSRLTARELVIAGGLHSSRLAATLFEGGHYLAPLTFFAKGHYFTYASRAPFSHLVYPLPADGGLGVHLTLDIAGNARFGPDVSWVEGIDYAFENSQTRRAEFITAIRSWWPGLNPDALQPGYTGVRPKLSRSGEPAADFAIHGPAEHGVDGLVALYGIESPGLTASLAIGRHVAALLGAGSAA